MKFKSKWFLTGSSNLKPEPVSCLTWRLSLSVRPLSAVGGSITVAAGARASEWHDAAARGPAQAAPKDSDRRT